MQPEFLGYNLLISQLILTLEVVPFFLGTYHQESIGTPCGANRLLITLTSFAICPFLQLPTVWLRLAVVQVNAPQDRYIHEKNL